MRRAEHRSRLDGGGAWLGAIVAGGGRRWRREAGRLVLGGGARGKRSERSLASPSPSPPPSLAWVCGWGMGRASEQIVFGERADRVLRSGNVGCYLGLCWASSPGPLRQLVQWGLPFFLTKHFCYFSPSDRKRVSVS
jgi:hypothetical protein